MKFFKLDSFLVNWLMNNAGFFFRFALFKEPFELLRLFWDLLA